MLLLAGTLIAAALALREVAIIGRDVALADNWPGVALQLLFALAFIVMVFGGVAYLLSRLGYLRRRLAHQPAAEDAHLAAPEDDVPPITVLVPSYREDVAVVRRTLLSAGLLAYPDKRIVLLIDDPYQMRDAAELARLESTRGLVRDLQAQFHRLAKRLSQRHPASQDGVPSWQSNAASEVEHLAQFHAEAIDWLDAEIRRYAGGDHSDELLNTAVLQRCRDEHRSRVARLRERLAAGTLAADAVGAEYRWLAARFRVEFASFERKRYENLSHEPNKAMNLNTYVALMGKTLRERPMAHGTRMLLEHSSAETASLSVPDTEFILTLDADSVLAPDYAQRLVGIMRKPGNERVAVAQTPYSAFPGAPGVLERIAGAQTDIQYLVHQGFTRHGATFWVGANALLRKQALEDIATRHTERGHPVIKYVQDRTPIEDTESSIDLADRGWTLHNHPERLAYSATPPDFGSLLIQRRRWANGGLIILPKALRYLLRGPASAAKAAEALLRVHYLGSVAAVNVAFLLIMFGPFERNLYIGWIPLSMVPYMFAYGRDLVHCGYRWSDFLGVYALNLLLLPINLGGTMRSLHQAVTGKKSPFARTPKVVGRTAAPGGYVIAEYMLLLVATIVMAVHLWQGKLLAAALGLVYVVFTGYAIYRFIGLRASVEDLRLWLRPADRAIPAGIEAVPGKVIPLAKASALSRRRAVSRRLAPAPGGLPQGSRAPDGKHAGLR